MISGPEFMLRYRDDEVTGMQVRPGTVRRVWPYLRRYRGQMVLLLGITAVGSAIVVVSPLILRRIIDDGILQDRESVVVTLAVAGPGLLAPSVVVLDEATAHLDSESEVAIQRALATALAGRTSLVIAHRLSTVRAADQILVVDGGQIAERGTHDELLGASGVYARLYRTRFAPQAALRSS